MIIITNKANMNLDVCCFVRFSPFLRTIVLKSYFSFSSFSSRQWFTVSLCLWSGFHLKKNPRDIYMLFACKSEAKRFRVLREWVIYFHRGWYLIRLNIPGSRSSFNSEIKATDFRRNLSKHVFVVWSSPIFSITFSCRIV